MFGSALLQPARSVCVSLSAFSFMIAIMMVKICVTSVLFISPSGLDHTHDVKHYSTFDWMPLLTRTSRGNHSVNYIN